MSGFNQVILIGNLTRDPQVKQLPSNTTAAEFGVAVNRRFRTADGEDREEVTFVDCTAFGRVAEVIAEHFTKGKQIFVQGRLKYDTWDDRQGGGKRSKLSVVVDTFTFLGGRDGGDGGGGYESQRDRQAPPRQQQRQQQQPSGNPGQSSAGYGNRQSQPPNDRRPPPRQQQRQPEEAPYGDEKQFAEDDIPF